MATFWVLCKPLIQYKGHSGAQTASQPWPISDLNSTRPDTLSCPEDHCFEQGLLHSYTPPFPHFKTISSGLRRCIPLVAFSAVPRPYNSSAPVMPATQSHNERGALLSHSSTMSYYGCIVTNLDVLILVEVCADDTECVVGPSLTSTSLGSNQRRSWSTAAETARQGEE